MFYMATIKSIDNGTIKVNTDEFAGQEDITFECKMAVIPGININYKVGDSIYVGLYNNDMNQPIAIGYPLSTATDSNKIDIKCNTLTAEGTVTLPAGTIITDKEHKVDKTITEIAKEASNNSVTQIINKIKSNFK